MKTKQQMREDWRAFLKTLHCKDEKLCGICKDAIWDYWLSLIEERDGEVRRLIERSMPEHKKGVDELGRVLTPTEAFEVARSNGFRQGLVSALSILDGGLTE